MKVFIFNSNSEETYIRFSTNEGLSISIEAEETTVYVQDVRKNEVSVSIPLGGQHSEIECTIFKDQVQRMHNAGAKIVGFNHTVRNCEGEMKNFMRKLTRHSSVSEN